MDSTIDVLKLMQNLTSLQITIQNETEAETIIKELAQLKTLNGIDVNREMLYGCDTDTVPLDDTVSNQPTVSTQTKIKMTQWPA